MPFTVYDIMLMVAAVCAIALIVFQLVRMTHDLHDIDSFFTDHRIHMGFRKIMLLIAVPLSLVVLIMDNSSEDRVMALLLIIIMAAVSGYLHLPSRMRRKTHN